MSTYTVADLTRDLKPYPDHARADIFSTVQTGEGEEYETDAVEVHRWTAIRLDPSALRLLAEPDGWREDGPAVGFTVGDLRKRCQDLSPCLAVTLGFRADYGEDRPLESIHCGWPIDEDGEPFVCIEIVRLTLAEQREHDEAEEPVADPLCEPRFLTELKDLEHDLAVKSDAWTKDDEYLGRCFAEASDVIGAAHRRLEELAAERAS